MTSSGLQASIEKMREAGVGEAAIDTFAHYSSPAGVTSVASCDIYEFAGEEITAITSYAVEVDPESAGSQPPPRGTS